MLGTRWWKVHAVVGVLALLVTACGNDDDGASGGDDQSDQVEVPTGPPVSGEAFKIGSIYTEGVAGADNGDLGAGARAGAEYVNKELGGIGVVGLSAVWGDNGLPISAEAEIPFVGEPVSNAEFLTPTSHPFGGGSLTAFPALAKYATEDLGVQSASILYVDLEAGEVAANALLGDPLREAGVDVTVVPEAAGAADFTSAVVKANEGDPDIMFILFAAEDCGRIVDAARQVGVTAQLAGSGSCADPAALDIAGEDALEGLLLNSDTHYVAQEGEPEFEDAEILPGPDRPLRRSGADQLRGGNVLPGSDALRHRQPGGGGAGCRQRERTDGPRQDRVGDGPADLHGSRARLVEPRSSSPASRRASTTRRSASTSSRTASSSTWAEGGSTGTRDGSRATMTG